MDDQSANRSEPTEATNEPGDGELHDDAPAEAGPADDPAPNPSPPGRARPWTSRGRLAVGGAAAAALVAVGAGGFAVGRATADPDPTPALTEDRGPHGTMPGQGGDWDRDGREGGYPGQPGLPDPGAPPGSGDDAA